MSNQAQYRIFCSQQADLPLFAQDWYLDAVCADGRWDAAIVEEAGRIAAALPYFLKQRGPFRYVTMPMLCKFMGPYFAEDITDDYKRQKLIKKLVAGLPGVDYFYQQFHYDCANWLPFFWAGFRQQTRYSYLLPDIGDLESTFAGIQADYRNHKLRRADGQLKLSAEVGPDDCFPVFQKSYSRQGLSLPFSPAYLRRLHTALQEHKAGRFFAAYDHEGNMHSAACLVWDRRSAYLLLAGDDPQYRRSGSGVWLTWQLIRYTSQDLQLNCFDFLGSMIEPIERVRRQFGAAQTPYHSVWRGPSPLFGLVRRLMGS